jgi:hypothetical protein
MHLPPDFCTSSSYNQSVHQSSSLKPNYTLCGVEIPRLVSGDIDSGGSTIILRGVGRELLIDLSDSLTHVVLSGQ